MNRRNALALLGALPFVAAHARAGEVPPERQCVLILRSLAYDRNFKARTGSAVNILVLYRGGNQPSESMKTDMVNAFEQVAKTVNVLDHPVRVSSTAYVNWGVLEEKMAAAQVSVLYACVGLDESIPAISEITRKRSALSIAANEAYLPAGLSIAIVARGTKPTIALNPQASHEEGCEWDPMFLRLAEITK